MEILETYAPKAITSCTLAKCELPDIFSSSKKIEDLKHIPPNARPIKDTFIMPAGGAVATRIFTRSPAPWLAHCHTDLHHHDGMGFIMNVGDDMSIYSDIISPPSDFPACDTPFHQSKQDEPHCDCYIDKDSILGTALDKTYKCSRPYLCMWEQSQVAILRKGNTTATYQLQSSYSIPGLAISLFFVCLSVLITIGVLLFSRRPRAGQSNQSIETEDSTTTNTNLVDTTLTFQKYQSFWSQLQIYLPLRWTEYRPVTINPLRVMEVVGLGLLTGFLFQDVGKNSTLTGLGEKTSLLFFSTTLWCQTRMYPSISNYFEYKHRDVAFVKKNPQSDLFPVFLSRMTVVIACEAWWPILFVLCAYPIAAMFGSFSKVARICMFLVLNNTCYIALGGLLGTVMPTVNLGMIAATLFAQTTVICAGFFTQLPPFVGWIRYISPIFYAFTGIIKTAHSWDDTYTCPKGHSAAGVNQCFLEMSHAIDVFKIRGINVATFGDPYSSQVHVEATIMICIIGICQTMMFIIYKYVLLSRATFSANNESAPEKIEKTNSNIFCDEEDKV